jgi:SAM-dependent methyltransferase
MAKERVGLDPVVPAYAKLGIANHAMQYCAANSENIPYPDGYFDIVTCLNALDHVDDIFTTITEIKRVIRAGGTFLLSVEINHPPTPTEPVTVNEAILQRFAPEFSVVMEYRVGTPHDHNLHGAVLSRSPAYEAGRPGIYVARFERRQIALSMPTQARSESFLLQGRFTHAV